jgi:hypothetical protein
MRPMNLQRLFFSLVLFLAGATAFAQGSAFGVKGGLTLGVQRWNNFDQDLLVKYHGILFAETLNEANDGALFAQLGYHVKGSAIRNNRTFFNNQFFEIPTREFQFRNLSLTLGGKKKYAFGKNRDARVYYLLGIRGDFTINTNLSEYQQIETESGQIIVLNSASFYPSDNWVQRFNYGATVGGGFEFPFSELIGGVLEFTVNPDLSRQYWQPALGNIPNPQGPGLPPINVAERKITNITFEVTLGLRFLRIIEYID